MTDAPEPPPPEPAPPPPPASAPTSPLAGRPAWLPFAIGAAALVAIALVALALRGGDGQQQDTYTVEAYTPAEPLMTASERVLGHDQPDADSPTIVMFGQGVALNVTGRVARGVGNEWLAVGWNERTVFVRLQDAVTGDGAPPAPIVRERQPEEEQKPEEEDEADKPEDNGNVEAPVAMGGTLDAGDVIWIRQPGGRDFARHYPQRALEDGQSGRVVLDCVIGGSGRLVCAVEQESPLGYGFGRAALGISRQARVQQTLRNGESAVGRHLRFPMAFQAG